MADVDRADHSGPAAPVFNNPYDALLSITNDDVGEIQKRYEFHRTARNEQQKAKLLDTAFSGWILDPYLVKLDGPRREPSFVDPRWNVCFWARPHTAVRQLIVHIQNELRKFTPHIWVMAPDCLHMTLLEIVTGATQTEVDSLVAAILPSAPRITDYVLDHRAHLVKPLLCFDTSALALTFVPATREDIDTESSDKDEYTYHHLRRDVHSLAIETGIQIKPRYILPSAHVTIARHISQDDILETQENRQHRVDHSKLQQYVAKIEELNGWLQLNFWSGKGRTLDSGVWTIGQERGLDFRAGQLWYGGGWSAHVGRSF